MVAFCRVESGNSDLFNVLTPENRTTKLEAKNKKDSNILVGQSRFLGLSGEGGGGGRNSACLNSGSDESSTCYVIMDSP